MIKSLTIKNYALIQSLDMQPVPGLNIITGETGAGKSIMLGAVGLLLGNRADTKALFSEDEKCVVEGIFDLSGYRLQELFEELELDFEKESIIRREISPGGKSRAFINDSPVTLDVLKAVGERLMDIHSQHESLELGSNRFQMQILDIYAGTEPELTHYQQAFHVWKKAVKHLETLSSQASEGAKELDFQQFQYNELETARLVTGEQPTLEQELELLENAEEIKTALAQTDQLLDTSEFSVVSQLKHCLPLLQNIRKYSTTLDELYTRLQSVTIEIEDIASEVVQANDRVELDPERLLTVKERLDLIYRLQQKHHVHSVEALIQLRDQLAEALESVSNLDEQIAKAEKAMSAAEKQMLTLGKALQTKRKQAAPGFATAIEKLIHQLGIENGRIEIEVVDTEPHAAGLDEVQMRFSANKGVTPKELKSVASGGEFSRLIFAIKYLLADKTALPTIIFDEIDTGVSGEVALQMIQMMRQMARQHQVIAISHLPQFAAGGEAHYFVYKDHSADRSVSRVKKLAPEERAMAIARMIGGDNPGTSAVESAKELLRGFA